MRSSKSFLLLVSLLIGGFFTNSPALAVTATIFTIDVPSGQPIDTQKDHYALVFEKGWVSREGGFLSGMFSSAKGGAFDIEGKVLFTDGTNQTLSDVITIDDPRNSMGRSLGLKGNIYGDLPADISQLDVSLRIMLTSEDRLAKLLGAIDSSKANLPAEVLSAPWLGYAKVVSTITQSIFGTNDSDYPLSGRYIIATPSSEQYIIMVASSKESDRNLAEASSNDFSYNSQLLKFKNGSVPREWTYFVLRVKKNLTVRTVASRAVGLDTPWATVINTQLYVLPTSKANDQSQLAAIAENIHTSLINLRGFLSKDRSFTDYDRALALYTYADNAVNVISETCKSKTWGDCPTAELTQFRTRVAQDNNIPEQKLAVAVAAVALDRKIQAAIKNSEIKPSSRSTLMPFVTLRDWEKYVEQNNVSAGDVIKWDNSKLVRAYNYAAPKHEQFDKNRTIYWDTVSHKEVAPLD